MSHFAGLSETPQNCLHPAIPQNKHRPDISTDFIGTLLDLDLTLVNSPMGKSSFSTEPSETACPKNARSIPLSALCGQFTEKFIQSKGGIVYLLSILSL